MNTVDRGSAMAIDEAIAAAKNLLGPIGLLVLSHEQSIERADGGRSVYEIPLTCLHDSAHEGATPRTIVPTVIDIVCPRCAVPVLVVLSPIHIDIDRRIALVQGHCPNVSCKELITCLAISTDGVVSHLAMYPQPVNERFADPALMSPLVPESILKHYRDATRLFRKAEWAYVPLACRKVMEGCLDSIEANPPLPSPERPKARGKAPLAQRLSADDSSPWATFIINHAHGIREAGNLAAHFEHMEATPQGAAAALDLVEGMMRFVFVHPARLETLLGALRAAKAAAEADPPP